MTIGIPVTFLERRGDVSGAETLETLSVSFSTILSCCAYALIALQIQQNSRRVCSQFWFFYQQDSI